jgi:hypothetical protein
MSDSIPDEGRGRFDSYAASSPGPPFPGAGFPAGALAGGALALSSFLGGAPLAAAAYA